MNDQESDRLAVPVEDLLHSEWLEGAEEQARPLIGDASRTSVDASPQSIVTFPSLSSQLRAETAVLHQRVEALLGLPMAIQRHNYGDWLNRFLGFYEPIEESLAAFPEWTAVGIETNFSRSACAAEDLTSLGIDSAAAPRISAVSMPSLPTFAHALGARYVLEGAALGSRVILSDIRARIGSQIYGATRFFTGSGDATGQIWKSFRTALDRFGDQRPDLRVDVATGARLAFEGFLIWFTPFCADASKDGTR
jgi:heme oxygenase